MDAVEPDDTDIEAARAPPSIAARALHALTDENAIALVDHLLGEAWQWPSSLIQYRFKSARQADWKAELGHWLHTSERLGFRDALVSRVLKRARRGSRSTGVDPNDQRHLDLQSEMAPAMVVHYLCGTGWTFSEWEPTARHGGDVDVRFAAPDGSVVNIQVKAPDQPGGRAGGRVIDGEFDERVIVAIRKAAAQLLPYADGTNVITISARRVWPLYGEPAPLVTHLYGSTLCDPRRGVWLRQRERGWFFTPWWRHVGAVVLLDYDRALGRPAYGCTVLLNPLADHPVAPNWFPHAHVCTLGADRFRWINGEPGGRGESSLPDGTILLG